jgi:hypothetical protein
VVAPRGGEKKDLRLSGPPVGIAFDEEPPGSRVSATSRPSARSVSARRRACVDLPEPSMPSKVMKTPLAVT